ncbi:T9SS type B sorting domain-containing protein [Aquimarina sediminis]|uniref:T9SS type B sorting domain-containing protein n=1 Tax=Aquimarina sediminis TaxID=2070536 RepID=UPI000CA022EE|nr:gliding motility-associated C-terminal domain-containing protein [Aquimarina sediminis]
MLDFTQFLQRKFKLLFRIVAFVVLIFSNSGFAQNILTNPGLDVAGVDCTSDNAAFDVVPDGWTGMGTPDRSTETQRAWYIVNEPRTASPDGGCYVGVRMFGAIQEGISQNVTLVGGELYSFSFDYLIETRPGHAACVPQLEVRLDGTLTATVPTTTVEDVWSRPTVTFTAPSSGVFSFQVMATGTCQGTWNFIDDLVLQIVDPDTDGDGNPDVSDPNPLVATAVDDTATGTVGVSESIDILGNDDYLDNSDAANLGTTSISQVGGTAGGTVTFDASTGEMGYTPAIGEEGSSVTIIYSVCNDESGVLVCDDATVTVTVASIIVANDDSVSIDGNVGGNSVNIVDDNDTLDSNPVNLGVDVTITSVTDPNPGDGVSLDAFTGEVLVLPNTPPGEYTIDYTLCSTATPIVCDNATVTITVTGVIVANDDSVSVDGNIGGNSINVVDDNDTLNANMVSLGTDVTVTTFTDPIPTDGVTFDPVTGQVSVAPNTPPGDYTIDYTLCSVATPVVCDNATIVITVTGTIIANDDSVSIDGTVGGTSINIVNDNDVLNNNAASLGTDVTITAIADPDLGDGVSLDMITGEISVAPNTPPGEYSITYTLCSVATPVVCDDAVIIITVNAIPNATVVGHVYNDLNGNGIQGINEPDLEGITIVITDVNGVEQTVATNADGDYLANVPEGITIVDIDNTTLPVGSFQTEGTDPTTVTVVGTTTEENNGFVSIGDVDDEIRVYNGISPNGDGINDQFRIVGLENFPDNTLEIFNRWGVKVFERDGYEQPGVAYFEGISEGRQTIKENDGLPVGTYYYVLKYQNASNTSKSKAGYLYLNK